MDLSLELRRQLTGNGASIVGYADLVALPTDARRDYRFGIGIGVALSRDVVATIETGPSRAYFEEYHRVNDLLNQLAESGADLLRARGFDAHPATLENVVVDQTTKRSALPHKTVATRAGLGWIGKCALLVTEQYGPAIRLSSVLTDAGLETAAPVNDSRCGSCVECETICPAAAISGKEWEVGMDRDELIRAFDCRDKITERGQSVGFYHGTCGLCIWACPWTREYLERTGRKATGSET